MDELYAACKPQLHLLHASVLLCLLLPPTGTTVNLEHWTELFYLFNESISQSTTFFFFFFYFLGPYLQRMEVPRLGVELKL